MKAPRGKRLSQRLSINRQKLAGSFHAGQPKITAVATVSKQSHDETRDTARRQTRVAS